MCHSCGSDKRGMFTAEIAIHFPGFKGLDKPHVWVFPQVVVCLNCGSAEFLVPENELRALAKGDAAAAGLHEAHKVDPSIRSAAARGVEMAESTLEIFRGAIGSGTEVRLEAVSGLENARRRMEQLAAASPGLYFVFSTHGHSILACADTRKSALPSITRNNEIA